MKLIGVDSVAFGEIQELVAGNALTGGGTTGRVTIHHDDTSSQASVNNSGRTYIQDVTLDSYGHVTALQSTAVSENQVMSSSNSYAAGLVLAGASSHDSNFLRKDGTWAVPTDTILGLLDEDDFGSNSAVRVPSQQSVKAYVDTGLAAKQATIGEGSLTIANTADLQDALDGKQPTIASGSRLNANLIGSDGAVGNTEFGRLDGVTGNIQTQIDAKVAATSFQYVFLHLSGQAVTTNSDYWFFPKDVGGVEYFKMEDSTDTVDWEATSFTLPRASQYKGIVVPYDCKLVGFLASHNASGNAQGAMALWTYQPHWGEAGSGGTVATRSHYAAANLTISSEGGQSWSTNTNYTGKPGKMVAHGGTTANVDAEVALTAGMAILPSIANTIDGGTGGSTQRVTATIILKVPNQTATY